MYDLYVALVLMYAIYYVLCANSVRELLALLFTRIIESRILLLNVGVCGSISYIFI